MKFDTEKKLTALTFDELKEMENETKKFLSKIHRAKVSLE